MSTDNMKLWNSVEKTDPNYTENVSYGTRKFTTVCAQWQIMQATKQFGPMGTNWGLTNETFRMICDDKAALYNAILYYPNEGNPTPAQLPVHSDMIVIKKDKGYQEDWSKKVATDALTKGLSKIGFSADLFLGKYDDSKYVDKMREEFNQTEPEKKKRGRPPKKEPSTQSFTPETDGLDTPLMLNPELLERLQNEIETRQVDVGKLNTILAAEFGINITHGQPAYGELTVEQFNEIMPKVLEKPKKI